MSFFEQNYWIYVLLHMSMFQRKINIAWGKIFNNGSNKFVENSL